jgi:tRNA threonylcarbamoyladenosine biosynthesis protein TsaB
VNILAIDTSTEACSAALLREDGEIFSQFEVAPRQHTRLLPRMMDQVLAASGIAKTLVLGLLPG